MALGVIVAIFPSRQALMRALDHLNEVETIDLKRAAIVARAKNGETVILDDDLSPDEGGIAGGTLGAAMGLFGMVQLGALALPGVGAIIALGTGVLVGGLLGNMTGRFAANLLDMGFRNEQVEALSDKLQAGHPALVLEVEDAETMLQQVRIELQDYQAELIEPLYRASSPDAPPDIDS